MTMLDLTVKTQPVTRAGYQLCFRSSGYQSDVSKTPS